MAKLSITAISEDTIAAPGNANNNYIVASVEDQNGLAVSGLAMANFVLGTQIVGPGGSISHISSVSPGSQPGVYLIFVLPLSGQTWKSGVYIFSVTVTRGGDRGQTLCSCLMD